MMARLAGMCAAAVLLGIGGLHVYWAAGGRWGSNVAIPSRHDGRNDGQPSFVPGRTVTLVVAGLLCAAALVLLGRLGLWGLWLPSWLFKAGAWTIAVVFGARVVGDFQWFGIFKRIRDTRFAKWDTRLYIPLCALLAISALVVAESKP
jgi:hypothetical protein